MAVLFASHARFRGTAMTDLLDITPLKRWIGKTETARDYLTDSLVNRFRATLDPFLWSGEDIPLGLHWCLALPTTPTAELSEDGHAKKGGFLPPVPLPSRMWAGGEVVHHQSFTPNAPVTRISTVNDVVAKKGKSGDLVFVTVGSEYYSDDRLCITERQDLVFRNHSTLNKPANAIATPNATATRQDTLTPDPVLLFRYSALTFNSHRIHYDPDYARDEEGYAGLVVHGPLQATLLLNLAARKAGKPPHRFAFRGLAPVTHGIPIELHQATENTDETVWCQTTDGTKSFTATYSDT